MRGAAAALLLLALAGGCEREDRRFQEPAPGFEPRGPVVQNPSVQPGPAVVEVSVSPGYSGNAHAVSEGGFLYVRMNCAGCHAPRGGGGMGPPLADSVWIYGSAPENVYRSIVEGRPNGMPAYQGRLTDDQVWKLTAYVRALAGLAPADVRPGRLDHLRGIAPTPQDPENPPVADRIPPERRPPGEAPR